MFKKTLLSVSISTSHINQQDWFDRTVSAQKNSFEYKMNKLAQKVSEEMDKIPCKSKYAFFNGEMYDLRTGSIVKNDQ